MRLTNKTNLNGRQLKAFIRAVAVREHLSPDIIKQFKVTVKYRKRSHCRNDDTPGGYAYLNTWTFCLKPVKGVMPGKSEFAKVIAHELAHCQGVHHGKAMRNNLYGWSDGWRENYLWAESLSLSFNEEVKPVTRDEKISTAVEHCERMVEQWKRRVKLAKTKETFWQRKLRYYNKRQAAASSAIHTAAVEKISTAVEAATSTATSTAISAATSAPAL
jgi:hypothetical protein